jgi:hypothetical protein
MVYKDYPGDWWRLLRAAQHLRELGAREERARADLSAALSDGKIHIRGKIAKTDRYVPGRTFKSERGEVAIPRHLKPGDFDWESSRPLKPWRTGDGRLGFEPDYREIGEIELLREEVLATFGESALRAGSQTLNERKRQAVHDAIAEIGIPVLAEELQKGREVKIVEWVAKNRKPLTVSPRYVSGIWRKARPE